MLRCYNLQINLSKYHLKNDEQLFKNIIFLKKFLVPISLVAAFKWWPYDKFVFEFYAYVLIR